MRLRDQNYDPVFLNGRVMGPETNLDDVHNVGVKDGKIAVIAESRIQGAESEMLFRGG